MKTYLLTTCFLLLVLLSSGISQAQDYDSKALPREQRMRWWEEARFGMFIHWGLYSIPGGVWEGKEIEELGEWIMACADISITDYETLAAQFNPGKFDPRVWVRMAKNAGMKYLVITTRHHDGFCLFDTRHTDWNVVDASPFKRDIIKELSQACKEEGITFCAYYSIRQGEWYSVGTFPGNRDELHKQVFGPETDPRMDQVYEEGKKWIQRRDWEDGNLHHFQGVAAEVTYIQRLISCSEEREMIAYVSSDDGLHVYYIGGYSHTN